MALKDIRKNAWTKVAESSEIEDRRLCLQQSSQCNLFQGRI